MGRNTNYAKEKKGGKPSIYEEEADSVIFDQSGKIISYKLFHHLLVKDKTKPDIKRIAVGDLVKFNEEDPEELSYLVVALKYYNSSRAYYVDVIKVTEDAGTISLGGLFKKNSLGTILAVTQADPVVFNELILPALKAKKFMEQVCALTEWISPLDDDVAFLEFQKKLAKLMNLKVEDMEWKSSSPEPAKNKTGDDGEVEIDEDKSDPKEKGKTPPTRSSGRLAKLDENAAKAKPVTMNVGQGSKSPAADDVMQQLFALQSMSNQLNKEREEDGRKQTDAKKPAKSGKSKLSTPQTSTKTEKKAPATTKKGRGYESDVESSSRGEKRNRVDLEPLREQISFLKQQMDELKLVHNKEKTEWEQEKKRLEAEKTKLQKEKEEQAIERAKLEGRMQGLEELVKAKEEMLSYFRSKH